MHGISDHPVAGDFLGIGQLRAAAAFLVRRDAACDDQANAAPCALGEVFGLAKMTVSLFFEPGMHRPHDRPVLDRDIADLERGEKQRVFRMCVAHRRLL